MFQLQKNAKQLAKSKVRSDVIKFLKSLEKTFAQYNKSQLFIDSSDLDGNPIGFYSKGTEIITGGKKKQGQPFNLFDTGGFLGKLFSKVENESIFFDTSDNKKKEVLSNLLSQNIFGLSERNVNKAILALKDFLQEYYLKNLLK